MSISAAAIATNSGMGFIGMNDGRSYNARRNGNDGITKYHNDRSNKFTQTGNGTDVAISYGSDSNNSPVNAYRDAFKLWVYGMFDEVKNRSEDANTHDNEE